MVSTMNIEPRAEICDSNRSAIPHSAISQNSIDFQMNQTNAKMDTNELSKKILKLQLSKQRSNSEKGSIDLDEKSGIKSPKTPLSNLSHSGSEQTAPGLKGASTTGTPGTQSATVAAAAAAAAAAGVANTGTGRTISHQSSITSQVDVVEDRKALRDALYQGIFHRHRRTIFAVGSFLRMLRSRNSQYNTIRSSSEGDEETR